MTIDRSLVILLYGVLAASTLAGSLDAQRGQAQLIKHDKARAEAKKQKKWLLTYFTRSYAP